MKFYIVCSSCSTLKNPHYSRAMNADYRSKLKFTIYGNIEQGL